MKTSLRFLSGGVPVWLTQQEKVNNVIVEGGDKLEIKKVEGAQGEAVKDKGMSDEMKSLPKPLRNQSNDASAESLLKDPPLLLRREQLQAPFRAKAEDEEEGDQEEDEKMDEDDGPNAKDTKPQAKAKGKAAAKAKAPAKAKAKATPKRKAKATPKGKAKATPKGKAKATPKAKAKGRKRSKEGDATEEQEDKRSKADPGKCQQVEGDQKCKTFARRYVPTSGLPALRFQAIQETYENEIANKIYKQSSFQEIGLKGWGGLR